MPSVSFVSLVLIALTIASYAVGAAIGVPALLPVLNTAASYPFMVLALRRGDLRLAVARMLLWAVTMGMMATLASYARPEQTGALFARSESYRVEMFAWVATGHGTESTPSEFIPQQIGHAALFSALAVTTGAAAAMPMGAVLMNYMGHYVGTLAAASRRPAWTMLLAWHPWAVIRVIGFVVIGVVLAAPLLSLFDHVPIDRAKARTLLAWACAGLVTDIVLKTAFAPMWQRLLLRVVGW